MPTTIQWDGLPRFDAEVLARIERARDAAHDFVAQGSSAMEGTIKVRAGEGGRHRRGTKTPAIRGRGPAVISGTLRRSVQASPVTSSGPFGFEAKVGPTTAYGRRVELEYEFPYVKPGTEDAIPRLVRLMGVLWRRAIG